MAWNADESMSYGGSGNGWGDDEVTFHTEKPQGGFQNAISSGGGEKGDRFPVSMSIAYILDTEIRNDKIQLGNEHFDTAKVLGIVDSCERTEASIKYILKDPEDDEKTIEVTHFPNTEREKSRDPHAEGTKLLVLGKIRTYGDNKLIASFFVKEIDDEEEWNMRLLEARYIRKLFESGILEKIASEGNSALEGWQETALGGPDDGGNATGGGTQGYNILMQSGTSTTRFYDQSGSGLGAPAAAPAPLNSSFAGAKSLGGTRGRILNFITSKRHEGQISDDGISLDDIMEGMKFSDRGELADSLNYLVAEGHLYNTSTEDKYLPIDS